MAMNFYLVSVVPIVFLSVDVNFCVPLIVVEHVMMIIVELTISSSYEYRLALSSIDLIKFHSEETLGRRSTSSVLKGLTL